MQIKTLLPGLAAALIAATTAMAGPTVVSPTPIKPTPVSPMPPVMPTPVSPHFVLRDSDGIVISVIHPVDYGHLPPVIASPGTVVYTFNGEVLPFTSMPDVMTTAGIPVTPTLQFSGTNVPGVQMDAANGPTLQIGSTKYQVEAADGQVWLRDLATGQRFATQRQVVAMAPDAVGLRVNPTGFALD